MYGAADIRNEKSAIKLEGVENGNRLDRKTLTKGRKGTETAERRRPRPRRHCANQVALYAQKSPIKV